MLVLPIDARELASKHIRNLAWDNVNYFMTKEFDESIDMCSLYFMDYFKNNSQQGKS